MSPLENALERYFFNKVRMIGGMAHKIAPTTKGMPDRLVLLPEGRMELVELKTTTGTVSPAQTLWHERAEALGTRVTVLAGKDAVDAWARARVSHADPKPGTPGRKKGGKASKVDGPVLATCHTCGRQRRLPTMFAGRTWLDELHANHNTELDLTT